jgi:hypothetical protein
MKDQGTGGAIIATSSIAALVGAVLLILLLIAAFYFLWPSSSGESKAVALQFQTGQQLRYRVSLVTKGTVSAGTLSAPIGMQVNAVADMRVTEVADDGTATVAVTLGNLQVSSQPQSWAHSFPTVVHTRMEIAPNGSIVSGGFGLADIATTGETSPGIGQFSPLLPPGPVQAGSTWTQTSKLPVLGDQTVTVTAKNKLLGFTENENGQVAVVTSSVTMPVSLSFPVADFASMASSNPAKQGQIAASDIVLESTGTSTVQMTSQISMDTNTLVSTHNAGTAQLTLAATSATAGAQGSLHLAVTDSMTIEKIVAQAKPPSSAASPKPSSSKSGAPLFP